MTGILSPVSIDSFTIAPPVSNTKSQGRHFDSGTMTISPGSNSELSTTYSLEAPLSSESLKVTEHV